MNAICRLWLYYDSPCALTRLAEHVIRAQRYSWASQGVGDERATSARETLIERFDVRALLQIENFGRELAYERSGHSLDFEHTRGLRYGGDVEDSTVLVESVANGSLAVTLAIPLTFFFAIYLA